MSFTQIIVWPFAKLLWLFNFTGSYAIALLFFAIVVKLILLPMSIKQQKTQIKGAKLRPKIAAIEKKYAGRTDRKTLEKKQQEITALQQEEGYSPLSGCLPLLIQFPIIIILYNIIQNPLTHVCGFSEEVITQLTAIAFPDGGTHTQLNLLAALQELNGTNIPGEFWAKIQDVNLNFLGLNMGVEPELTTIYVIIPILTALSSYASMKLTRKFMGQNPALQAQNPDMRTSNIIMDLMMPLMSLCFAFQLPALLGLYWIYQSVLGVIQQFILSKAMPLPTYTEEEIRTILKMEKERANANRAAMRQQGSYNEKSLHHIDDDDDDEDVYIPEIRSKFDDDDEVSSSPAQAPALKESKPSANTHQRQRKKKK